MRELLISLNIPAVACPYIMKTNHLLSPLQLIHLYFFFNIFSHTVQVLGKACMSLLTPAHSQVTEEWVLDLEQFLTKRWSGCTACSGLSNLCGNILSCFILNESSYVLLTHVPQWLSDFQYFRLHGGGRGVILLQH